MLHFTNGSTAQMDNQDQFADAQRINPYELANRIANHLTQAWNAGDGQAFAQPFAENADFVTVFGELLHSRQAIGQGHDLILNTIFTGTQLQYTVRDAAWIDTNTVLAHVNGIPLVAKEAMVKRWSGYNHAGYPENRRYLAGARVS